MFTYLNFKFYLLGIALRKVGAIIVDTDIETFAYLIDFDRDSSILISLEENGSLIRMETTIIFNAELVNLKTISSMAHAAYFSGFSMTGVSPKGNGDVKIYVGKEISFSSLLFSFSKDIVAMHEVIQQLAGYLYYRTDQITNPHLDLSMFEDIDVDSFDPKSLGEAKEFIFKNWEDYIEAVLDLDANDDFDLAGTIYNLQACAEFEDANDQLLAEVGDKVLEEIIWNRKFSEVISQNKYYIN